MIRRLALLAILALVAAPAAGAGPIIGQVPDVAGLSAGYLGGCQALKGQREWNCYLINLRRTVLADKDPAHQLPDLDVRARQSGGYLEASCHMLMHVVGRDYARVHHVTLQNLQHYLPLSNDPGCSAGFGMGLVMGISTKLMTGGPKTAEKICNSAPTRFRQYTCYHALGHAYMRFFHGYIKYSLQQCAGVGPQRPDCAQGVFHDYWLGLSGQDGAKFARGTPKTARALCAKQHGSYVMACWYRYYVSLPPKRTPSTASRIDALCTGLRGAQREGCIASASIVSSTDPVVQFKVCSHLAVGDIVPCLRGVGYQNLPDAQHNGLQLIRKCATLAAGAQQGCYTWLGTALDVLTDGTFAKQGCGKLSGDAKDACEAGVKASAQPLLTFA